MNHALETSISPQADQRGNIYYGVDGRLTIDHFVARIMCMTEGAVILRDRTRQYLVHSRADILSFFAQHAADGALSLVTKDGEVAGVAFVHMTFDDALAFKDRYGYPSLALVGDTLVVTAWLLDAPCALADLARVTSKRRNLQMAIPVPGLGGWELAREEYSCGEFTRFPLRDLILKFANGSVC